MNAFRREWRLLLISSPLTFIHFLFPFSILFIRVLSGEVSVDSPLTLLLIQAALIIPVSIFNGLSYFPLQGSAGFYRELGRSESDFSLILSKVSASWLFSLLLFLPGLPEIIYLSHLYRFDYGIIMGGIVFIFGGFLILNLFWLGVLLLLKRSNIQIMAGLVLGVFAEGFLFIMNKEKSLIPLSGFFLFFTLVLMLFFLDYLLLRKIRKNSLALRRIDKSRILFPLALLFFMGSLFSIGKQIDISHYHLASPDPALVDNLRQLDDPLYVYLPEQNNSIQFFHTQMKKKSGREIILNRVDDGEKAGVRYRNQFFPLSVEDIEIRLDNAINRIVDFLINQRETIDIYILFHNEEEREDPWIIQLFSSYGKIYQLHWIQTIPDPSENSLILIRNSDSLSGDEIAALYYWQQSGGALIMLMNGLNVDPVNSGRANYKENLDSDLLIFQLWGIRALPTLVRETLVRSGQAVSLNENRLVYYPFWCLPLDEPYSGFQTQTRESRLLWVSPLEIDATWQDKWVILQQSSFESDTVQSSSFSLTPGGEAASFPENPGGQVPFACWLPGKSDKGDLIIWGSPWSFSSYADVAGGQDNGHLLISSIDLIFGNTSSFIPDKSLSSSVPLETPNPFRYLVILGLINTLFFVIGRLFRRLV